MSKEEEVKTLPFNPMSKVKNSSSKDFFIGSEWFYFWDKALEKVTVINPPTPTSHMYGDTVWISKGVNIRLTRKNLLFYTADEAVGRQIHQQRKNIAYYQRKIAVLEELKLPHVQELNNLLGAYPNAEKAYKVKPPKGYNPEETENVE